MWGHRFIIKFTVARKAGDIANVGNVVIPTLGMD
jgi:hypothetical protein